MNGMLVVGEALIDIVERPGSPTTEHPGGSPANVALGLARLGHPADLLTRIGNDRRGRAVRAYLECCGVRLVPGSVTDEPTSTATAHLDPDGVASYDFDLDWRLPDSQAHESACCLHTGSIAAFLPPGGDAVLNLVEKMADRATISYDPNIRLPLMGDPASARQRVETFVRCADVVKVSEEDLARLAPGEDPVAVAQSWLATGPAIVVVTLGGRGAVGLCAAGRADVPAPAITVVDTLGAGDSLMAGLLDHLAALDLLGPQRLADLRAINLADVDAMLRHAVRIAAITCTRAGANPPNRAELEAWAG